MVWFGLVCLFRWFALVYDSIRVFIMSGNSCGRKVHSDFYNLNLNCLSLNNILNEFKNDSEPIELAVN